MSNSDAPLHSLRGAGRKYLNHDERLRILAAAEQLADDQRLFVEVLAWTGARISEVLMLTPQSFDLFDGTVTLPTLKRRRHVLREVPLPPHLIARLKQRFDLQAAQRSPAGSDRRVWPFCRVTGWRIVKRLMRDTSIAGARATPRGMRHGFGVGTLQSGVPITLLKRWLGHARLSTTEIYLDVIGPEELAFASLFWSQGASMLSTQLQGVLSKRTGQF